MRLMRATCWCAVFLFASNAANAMARSHRDDAKAGGAKLSFLSGPEKQTEQPAPETPPATPQDGNRNFDGLWTFTSAGCTDTGSLPARIFGGKRHDPYRSRAIVGKYRFRDIQSIRRLFR